MPLSHQLRVICCPRKGRPASHSPTDLWNLEGGVSRSGKVQEDSSHSDFLSSGNTRSVIKDIEYQSGAIPCELKSDNLSMIELGVLVNGALRSLAKGATGKEHLERFHLSIRVASSTNQKVIHPWSLLHLVVDDGRKILERGFLYSRVPNGMQARKRSVKGSELPETQRLV